MKKITLITALAALIACNNKPQFDASGNFTADEVIVSAQQTLLLHKIQLLQAQENQKLINGQSSPSAFQGGEL